MLEQTIWNQKMKTTKPSAQVIGAAQMLIAAMAHEDTVGPIVEAYENAILAKHQWHIAPEYMVEFEMSDRVILNREEAYLLGSANIAEFYKECVAQRAAKGLHTSHPDGCPLLEAKHHRFQAEKELLKVMGTMPGLEPLANGEVRTVDLRKRVIDLSLRFVKPFIGQSDRTPQKIAGAY